MLPSILLVQERQKLVHMAENAGTVEFLKFGFPMGYEGQVMKQMTMNHPSASSYACDLVAYIAKTASTLSTRSSMPY